MPSILIPGLIDAHVHLRQPGAPHKERIATGTAAALAGGVVGVLDMPNNTPPLLTRMDFFHKVDLFNAQAVSDYGLFCGYQAGRAEDACAVAPLAIGCKLYLDETHNAGGDPLSDEDLDALFASWPGPGPIAIHASSASIRRVLRFAERYDQPLHVCHVPHPDDLLVIDAARQAGVNVTCEVTPHHLLLTTEDAERLGPLGQMKPPLLPPEIVKLYWERLDLVDIIATDHAPHTLEEKAGPNPPPGVPGLETLLPLMLQAVREDRLTMERLMRLLVYGPARVYHLDPPDAEVHVSLEEYTLPEFGYQTLCGWSPFGGRTAYGRVESVTLRGKIVYENGQVLAEPGSGRLLSCIEPAGLV